MQKVFTSFLQNAVKQRREGSARRSKGDAEAPDTVEVARCDALVEKRTRGSIAVTRGTPARASRASLVTRSFGTLGASATHASWLSSYRRKTRAPEKNVDVS
jgi:hypothetical protein